MLMLVADCAGAGAGVGVGAGTGTGDSNFDDGSGCNDDVLIIAGQRNLHEINPYFFFLS